MDVESKEKRCEELTEKSKKVIREAFEKFKPSRNHRFSDKNFKEMAHRP